jgi:hypothetical protein
VAVRERNQQGKGRGNPEDTGGLEVKLSIFDC